MTQLANSPASWMEFSKCLLKLSFFESNLRIVTWNANSIKAKLKEFKHFLYVNNYDVAGICETKTDVKYKLKIPGYKVYLRSRNNRGGGVAILVKQNIEHDYFELKLKNIEFVGVKIFSQRSNLIIGQVYKPPNKPLCNEDLNLIFCSNNILIMGDLNCKRKEWNCPTDNPSGDLLLNYCLKNKISISAPFNCTNFPTVGNPSVIDFFLLKCRLNHSLPITKSQLSSDHNPVEILVAYNCKLITNSIIFDYSMANWKNFREELNQAIDLRFHIKNGKQVEEKTEEFMKLISLAVHNNVPTKKVNFHIPILPTYLKSLITYKNKLRKILQSKPSLQIRIIYKKFVDYVRHELKLFDAQNFEKYIKKLNFKDGSIWKFSNKYSKKSENATVLYDENNIELKTGVDRANAFANYFSSMSNVQDLGSNFFTKKVNQTVKNFLKQEVNVNTIKFANFTEVVNALKTLKNDKASGHDKISSRVLKNLPRKAIVYIVKLVNGILCTSHFPTVWKISKVIPIFKKKKDITQISSYRPISLLPHISKVMEKIVKNRIVSFMNDNKIMNNEQFGFRCGHGTTDQLARLVNDITLNFNKKMHTGALLLDIESAFPSVWHTGIIYKMIMYKFPVYLIFFICSYLDNRKFFVFVDSIISIDKRLLAGVPQGSVLGPILFIIFINDAPKIVKVDESVFADDKLLYTASYRVSAIVNRLQQAFKAHKRYFHKWKIKINSQKTELILFTKRRPCIENVKIDDLDITWQSSVKYLGVMLDHKLIFNKHINYIVTKTTANLIKFYPIFKNKYLSSRSKIILYKSLIRSSMLYACPIWSMSCQSNLNKLQIAQNKFLRIIGNYRKFSLVSTMHNELNIEYINEYIHVLSSNYFRRIEMHQNALVRNICYDKSKKYRHKRIMHIV